MNTSKIPYEYEEDEYEEGLTFKKVGHFFKKGWLRMIVYALILAVAASVVVLPIKVFYKSENVAQTSIEFIYDGIEKGQDPNGGTFDMSTVISTTVLDNAVKAANLQDKIADITSLRDYMRVEGELTDEYVKLSAAAADGDQSAINTLRNYEMFSTRFNIILSEPQRLGLSDSEATLLLDETVAAYVEEFKRRYTVIGAFSTDAFNLSANSFLEFTDIYDLYTRSLAPVSAYIDILLEEAPSFVSTVNNETFTTLKSKLELLTLNYTIVDNYILTNSVFRDKKSAKIALQESKKRLEGEMTSLGALIEKLETQLKNWSQKTESIISPDGGMTVITTNDKEYIALQTQLTEYKKTEMDYANTLNSIDMRLGKITDETPTDSEHIDNAVKMFKAIEEQTVALVEKVNDTITDYYDTTFVSQSVRKVLPPVMRRKTVSFNIWIIYLCVVAAGLIAGGIVTGSKIIRANAAAKKAKTAENNAAEDTAAEDTAAESVSTENDEKA